MAGAEIVTTKMREAGAAVLGDPDLSFSREELAEAVYIAMSSERDPWQVWGFDAASENPPQQQVVAYFRQSENEAELVFPAPCGKIGANEVNGIRL